MLAAATGAAFAIATGAEFAGVSAFRRDGNGRACRQRCGRRGLGAAGTAAGAGWAKLPAEPEPATQSCWEPPQPVAASERRHSPAMASALR